jgi:hypothetical protein
LHVASGQSSVNSKITVDESRSKPLPAPRLSWYAKWINAMLLHYPGHPAVRHAR